MQVTIPLDGPLLVLAAYSAVGVALVVPMRLWARLHVSPRPSLGRALRGTEWWQLPVSVLAWPAVLQELGQMERRWPTWTRRWRA